MDKTRRLLLALIATAIAAVEGVAFVAAREPDDPSVAEIVLAILEDSSQPLSRQQIGKHEGLKGESPASIDEALNALIYQGRIRRRGDGTPGNPYLYEDNVTRQG
jgi:hypothetical protein